MWPAPGKEPPQDVDSRVLVPVHHEATGPTAIHALVERHRLHGAAPTTGLTGIAFIYANQFFPSQETLVLQHLHKAIQSPIVEDRSMHEAQLVRMLFRNHLPLGKITNHNSSCNQFVSDEMRGLVQTVPLFGPLLF